MMVVVSVLSTWTSKVVPRTEITAVGENTRVGFGRPPSFSMWTLMRPKKTSTRSLRLPGLLRKTTLESG